MEKYSLQEIIFILDLNNLEDIDDKKIKIAYRKMMNKYHPDLNPDMLDASDAISKFLNNAYDQVVSSIKMLRERHNDENTNSKFAKMYGTSKKEMFGVNNKETRNLTIEFINRLYQNGMDVVQLIRFMNALEYGMITVQGIKKVEELFGSDFCELFSEFLETEAEDYTKYYQLIGQMNYLLVESNFKKI